MPDRTPPRSDLSSASRAVLNAVVAGARVDHVPGQLVELGLVRVQKLKRVDGLVGLFWGATKSGMIEAANGSD